MDVPTSSRLTKSRISLMTKSFGATTKSPFSQSPPFPTRRRRRLQHRRPWRLRFPEPHIRIRLTHLRATGRVRRGRRPAKWRHRRRSPQQRARRRQASARLGPYLARRQRDIRARDAGALRARWRTERRGWRCGVGRRARGRAAPAARVAGLRAVRVAGVVEAGVGVVVFVPVVVVVLVVVVVVVAVPR